MPTEAELAILKDIKCKADMLLNELEKLPPVLGTLKSIERLTEAVMWAEKAIFTL